MADPNDKQDWFKEWFDSSYYHLLYQNRNEEEAEKFINNILGRISLKSGAKILDMACGRGRHAKYLNQLGYDVTGIDLSPQSIAFGKQFENRTLSFHVHDMRIQFKTDCFDCVLNLFTSIGYFEDDNDNFKTVLAASQSLVGRGLLIIDFMNAKKVMSNLKRAEEKIIEDVTFKIDRYVQNGFIVKDIQVIDKENKYKYQERLKTLTLENFNMYFSKSGIELIHLFGSYDLSDFDEDNSDRLILVGQKVND